MEDRERVRRIARLLREREAEWSRREWVQYTTGFDFGVNQAESEYIAVLKDRENYRAVERLLGQRLSPRWRRRLEILRRHFKPYQLTPRLHRLDERIRKKTLELSQVLNGHRCRLEGRTVSATEIDRIWRISPDRGLRRQAFLARAQVNRPLLQAGFLDLIEMRREFAALYGAEDFVAYRLERDEISPRIFIGWEQQAAPLRENYQRLLESLGQRFLGGDKPMPWDLPYMETQLAPQLQTPVDISSLYKSLHDLFNRLGYRLDQYNITYDIFPRRHKSEWGYNFTIVPGGDSRILANVEGRYYELGVLLHETGHALHSFRLDPRDYLMNLGVSGIIAEGLANLFGDLLLHPAVYGQFFVGRRADADRNFARLRRFQQARTFTAISSILFDQELYRRDLRGGQEVDRLYWEFQGRILGEPPYAREAPWGFRIHHTTHPVYLHNYFLGDLTNRMLRKVFIKRHRVQDVMEKPRKFGRFIEEEVIAPSGRWPFEEWFERISGRPFSLEWLRDG